MKLYFRCSVKPQAISYVQRWDAGDSENPPTKEEIIKKCWLSLQKSVTNEDELIILRDEVPQETLSFLENTAQSLVKTIEVPKHTWEDHQHMVVLFNELDKELTNSNDSDWHYLIEDDYLHTPDALHVLRETQKYWGGFIVPQDYPDRYKQPVHCQVFVGPDRHWRTVNSSTMNMIARTDIWRKYMPLFHEAAPISNDKILEDIYPETPCICPLPGVASHLTMHHHTPLVDWTEIWNGIKI